MSALFDRVASIPRGVETIKNWLSEGGVPVSQELAQSRADICLQCPKNNAGSILTQTVAEAVRRHVEVKNHLGLRVEGEKKLGECSVCLCQLRLKVWVPLSIVRKQMTPEEFENFPTPCWQREETL